MATYDGDDPVFWAAHGTAKHTSCDDNVLLDAACWACVVHRCPHATVCQAVCNMWNIAPMHAGEIIAYVPDHCTKDTTNKNAHTTGTHHALICAHTSTCTPCRTHRRAPRVDGERTSANLHSHLQSSVKHGHAHKRISTPTRATHRPRHIARIVLDNDMCNGRERR
jgi:hypothetical protein